MKTIILAISLTILNFTSFKTNAQTYTTESKSSMDRPINTQIVQCVYIAMCVSTSERMLQFSAERPFQPS